MKTIHFICIGNVYRSRLAEAYFNSHELPQMKAISSGTHAQNNISGPICWYAERIIQDTALVNFMSNEWTPTTLKLLDESDMNIFMDPKCFDFAKNILGYVGTNYKIWNTPDFECHYHLDPKEAIEEDIKLLKKSNETYYFIKENVDKLIKELNPKENPFADVTA